MTKAILFDLDGTLTDTLSDIADAMNRALSLHGLAQWRREDYRYLVGNGARVLAERAVRGRSDAVNDVLGSYQAWYETHSMVKTKPYEGIPELLEALCAQGYSLCVLSNKPDADTKRIVAHFFPNIPFASVRGQRPGIPTKPDPASALATAENLGLQTADFCYLGDTSIDMTCARRAGMMPIGVLWGFRDEKELRDSGAAHIIQKPEDLLQILRDE